jgi:hypothetical protein
VTLDSALDLHCQVPIDNDYAQVQRAQMISNTLEARFSSKSDHHSVDIILLKIDIVDTKKGTWKM